MEIAIIQYLEFLNLMTVALVWLVIAFAFVVTLQKRLVNTKVYPLFKWTILAPFALADGVFNLLLPLIWPFWLDWPDRHTLTVSKRMERIRIMKDRSSPKKRAQLKCANALCWLLNKFDPEHC